MIGTLNLVKRKLTKPGRGNPGGKPGPGPLAAAKKAS